MGEVAPKTKRIRKRIILLRHSRKGKRQKFKNMLSKKGLTYARKIGRSHIRGRCITGVFISELMRTCQTAMALIEGAGDCTCSTSPTVKNVLGMPMSEWIKYCPTGHEGLNDIECVYPKFIRHVSAILLVVMTEIITETPENGTSLVVGHSPCTELIIRILTTNKENPNGITIDPLSELEGVVLAVWDDGSITLEEEIRHAV